MTRIVTLTLLAFVPLSAADQVVLTNGDTITGTFSSTATTASVVGTYPITAALTDPGSKLANYIVTTNSGTLTVTNAALTVSITNQSRSYGAANPTFAGSVTGQRNGDVIEAPHFRVDRAQMRNRARRRGIHGRGKPLFPQVVADRAAALGLDERRGAGTCVQRDTEIESHRTSVFETAQRHAADEVKGRRAQVQRVVLDANGSRLGRGLGGRGEHADRVVALLRDEGARGQRAALLRACAGDWVDLVEVVRAAEAVEFPGRGADVDADQEFAEEAKAGR